mgnify:CR=1 FL=1
MWLFLSDSYLSVVAHREQPGSLLVRARNKQHIENFLPGRDWFKLEHSDYPYRLVISKNEFAELMLDYITDIKYCNFKSSVTENDYRLYCSNIWKLMYEYGRNYRW